MAPEKEVYGGAPRLTPNMYVSNADVRQSTWHESAFLGSLFTQSIMDDSQFLYGRAQRATFAGIVMDGSRLVGCSMRDVVIENCDLRGLIIDGVRIGDLIASEKGAD
ncbi:pentapeptide repeat-containing protein [Streptomyces sp. NPDC059917]|uniref:pentapeptide repeat-containing protein n=1 Tax=Streptomyces sp. NPDC059917 TaxID=3347002 RepID=UPI00365FF073